MRSQKLLYQLVNAVTGDEWEQLNSNSPSLLISSFNRESLLSMQSCFISDFEIDTKPVQDLNKTIQKYLNQYMSDHPEGHKWIILASIYLTFIKKCPMHPQEAVHWKYVAMSSKPEYFCPHKDLTEKSVCSYCICQTMKFYRQC